MDYIRQSLRTYFAVYIDICHSFSKRKAVYLFLLGISVCLTRNNGIHLVLPSLILLFFFLVKGARKYAFIVAVCVFACYLGVEKGAAPALGVAPGSRCEIKLFGTAFNRLPDI